MEQADRRLHTPLWQNWDRPQKLLLPLIAPMEPGRAASRGGPAGAEALWSTDAEAEAAVRFTHAPFGVNDGGFALDQDGVAKGTESFANLKTPVPGHAGRGEEGGAGADVLESHFNMSTGDPRWLSSGLALASFGSAESSPGTQEAIGHHKCQFLVLAKQVRLSLCWCSPAQGLAGRSILLVSFLDNFLI